MRARAYERGRRRRGRRRRRRRRRASAGPWRCWRCSRWAGRPSGEGYRPVAPQDMHADTHTRADDCVGCGSVESCGRMAILRPCTHSLPPRPIYTFFLEACACLATSSSGTAADDACSLCRVSRRRRTKKHWTPESNGDDPAKSRDCDYCLQDSIGRRSEHVTSRHTERVEQSNGSFLLGRRASRRTRQLPHVCGFFHTCILLVFFPIGATRLERRRRSSPKFRARVGLAGVQESIARVGGGWCFSQFQRPS